MNDLLSYLDAPTPILVALVCNAIGFVIKKTPFIDDRAIPILLMLIGTLIYLGIDGWTWRHLAEGIVTGAGAVGFNQAIRQILPQPPETPK
jgi:hypothetical protein